MKKSSVHAYVSYINKVLHLSNGIVLLSNNTILQ